MKPPTQPTVRIFDLDNTLTESKQKISLEMKKALLAQNCPIIVISGANREQIEYQLDGLFCTILAQSGNDTPKWKNELKSNESQEVWLHINSFAYCGTDMDSWDNRGSQISFSFIGHRAEISSKKKFDPERKIRQAILKQHPFKSKTLQVTIAGTTCLDYTRKNGTKGKNIERWIKENKLNKKDCVYYGDALFKGGNDESVKDVIRCISVKNPADLLKKLHV